MKNILFYCLLFLFTVPKLSAQAPDIQWGEASRYKSKNRPVQILLMQGEQVYLLCGKSNGAFNHYQIEVFDNTTFAKLRSIPLSQVFPQSAELTFDEVSVYHGTAYFFLRDKKYLYCSTYHFTSAAANVDARRICPLPEPQKPFSQSDAHSNVFFSEAGEYMVVYYNLRNSKNEYEKILYTLLDTNLKQVDQRHLHLPYKDKHYQDYKYWVDTKGDLTLLGFKRTEKSGSSTPVLFSYDRQSEEAHEVTFPMPQGYLQNFHFTVQKGELRYQGLYQSNEHVFFYRYCYNLERSRLVSSLSVDLSASHLAIHYPFVYDDDLDLKHFELLEVTQLTPDTLLIVLEHQTFSKFEPKGYYFEDLIVFKATTRGDVVWITKIPKRQALVYTHMPNGFQNPEAVAQGSDLLSATILQGKGKTYLLYNDHKENGSAYYAQDLQSLRFKPDAALYLVQVNEQGKWERKALSSSYYLSHSMQYTLPEGFIALAFNRKRREWRWVRVE